MTANKQLTEARTLLLANSWSVIPLHRPMGEGCSCTDGGVCVRGKPGKHAAVPWKEYMTGLPTEKNLNLWFATKPERNLGIVTGMLSNVVVLDVDGEEGQQSLRDQGVQIPFTPTVKTANGFHYYFQWPGYEVRNFVRQLPGLDFRGDGGYVVAPPSLHHTGHVYFWEVEPYEPLAPMPAWLLDLLTLKQENGHTPVLEPVATVGSDGTSRYGQVVLTREAEYLANVKQGSRNTALNKSSFAVGRLVAGGEVSQEDAEAALTQAGLAMGLDPGEVAATVNSGLSSGDKAPRSAPLHLTELGNAQRLVRLLGGNARFVPVTGSWLFWNRQYWERDETLEIMRYVREVIQQLHKEAARSMTGDESAETMDEVNKKVKWAFQSETKLKMQNTVDLSRSEPGIPLLVSELDRDNWLFNVQNGTINLRTGELLPHRKEDYITKLSPAVYVDNAPNDLWLSFLDRIFLGNRELIEFIQRAVGYSLTGSTREQVLFFLYGTGKNGKTTFVEVLRNLMGGYALKASMNMLAVQERGNQASNEIARLFGSRLVVASEIEEDRRLHEAMIKDLTGTDTISARFLYKEPFEFLPTHKLWIYGNHRPLVRGTDTGFWRRIMLVPFEAVITPEERVPDLIERLNGQRSGILNWAVQGLNSWREQGLNPPDIVLAATDQYRAEMDTLGAFLEDRLEKKEGARLRQGDLYIAYQMWAEMGGARPMTQNSLARKLRERGIEPLRSKHGMFYEGLRLRSMLERKDVQ